MILFAMWVPCALIIFSVNGVPRPPEHSLVAEFRRELTELRDRVNYLLNRLDTSGEGDSTAGGQQQDTDQKRPKGLISFVIVH